MAGYTLLAPFVILACYPGCFLFGGVLITLLPTVARAKRPRLWLGYGLLAAMVVLTTPPGVMTMFELLISQ